jgi:hypothetical protein
MSEDESQISGENINFEVEDDFLADLNTDRYVPPTAQPSSAALLKEQKRMEREQAKIAREQEADIKRTLREAEKRRKEEERAAKKQSKMQPKEATTGAEEPLGESMFDNQDSSYHDHWLCSFTDICPTKEIKAPRWRRGSKLI